MSKVKETYYLDFFNNLIEGNKYNCSQVVNLLVEEKADLIDIYLNLFQRALYRVGKMWEQNKITVANEHLCTQITEHLMSSIYNKYVSDKRIGKKVIVTCVDKEYHKIGAKMVADVFEFNGWDSFFLGASTPNKEVVDFIRIKKPDVIALSFNFYMNLLRFYSIIDNIKKDYPDIQIVVGGQGVEKAADELKEKYSDINYFDSIKELNDYLKMNK